ncbi:MAG TPA: ABC transporter substrate-binding protein [Candidatus Paceibacterota bacterium]|nr:oligopeptide-binding protein AppA [uncultured archaeon]
MDKEKLKNLAKKEWHLPYSEKVHRVIKSFSLSEKVVFFFFTIVFILSGISLLYQLNKLFLVTIPDYGGTLSEGVIGSPRFVNPLLATSDIDKDLITLMYSGLMKVNSDGELVPDLAESYSISPDSLTYTFILKDNLYFHDGTKLTTDDIVFTIERAQDPGLKSPREANWSGVTVKKIDDKTISFTLKQPYSPFIQNTTLGILPKHIWKTASVEELPFSQFNIKPVGSGPYKIESIIYTSSGLPEEYKLVAFKKYSLGEPYITSFSIKSYQNEKDIIDAYNSGNVETVHGITPNQIAGLKTADSNITLAPLPRIFGVFFNQNVAPVFLNKEVRQALNMATDKQEIINNIIGGYGQPIDSPVPVKTISNDKGRLIGDQPERLEKAKALLVKNGWKENTSGIFEKKDKKNTTTLSFSISTGDAPELKETAYLLQRQWRALGADVKVKIFETGDLNQNIIRPRKYDSLLFGEIVGRDLDLYPFWHSSERASPGLNIALYANVKTDKLLENIRKTSDPALQQTYLNNFSKEIRSDVPAIFTYSPYFIYIVPKKVNNIKLGTLTASAERFSNIGEWYIETNNVWEIFAKQK